MGEDGAEEGRNALVLDEVLATTILLLVAGHETTANAIGNGVLALLEHPDQCALLRRRPELLDAAVEEILRFEGPAKIVARTALIDTELAGLAVRAGDRVLVALGAVNRDPAQFADPDTFDIARPRAAHLALGAGAHFCLGAALTRTEIGETLRALLPVLPDLRLPPGPPCWRVSQAFRGLESLRLTQSGGHSEMLRESGAPVAVGERT